MVVEGESLVSERERHHIHASYIPHTVDVLSYGGSFYATYTTPIGFVLSSDLNYSATSGYSQGYDTRTWMWNASLSYQFLRGRNAAVSLKAYDLLGQRSSVRRSVTASYIDDSMYNSLTRYVMLKHRLVYFCLNCSL